MLTLLKSLRAAAATAALAGGLALAAPAAAADPLVDVNWIKGNAGADGVVVVDLRGKTDYLRGHIPGAVHTNYGKDGWRVAKDGIIGLFPEDVSKLEALIGGLGIGNDSHVVLVPPGASSSDMGMGTRVYWTFKVLGHDAVSILNGGMTAYLAEADKDGKPVNPLEQGAAQPSAASFTASLRQDMLIDAEDVKAMMDAGVALVDNRTHDQFLGVNRHPKATASGTIPGAVNLPQNWLTENGGGTFRDADTLRKLYAFAGVPVDAAQVSFCNTGHWASIGWFVTSEILGNGEAKMYDGSMVDWTARDMPMASEANL